MQKVGLLLVLAYALSCAQQAHSGYLGAIGFAITQKCVACFNSVRTVANLQCKDTAECMQAGRSSRRTMENTECVLSRHDPRWRKLMT